MTDTAQAEKAHIKSKLLSFSRPQLRLITGLVLFGFVASHLLNHALGLVSMESMADFREVRIAITRSWLCTFLLLVSALLHAGLGIEKILVRKLSTITLRDVLQILTGILIPILLARHIIGTRIAHELFGVNDNYEYALWAMWPGEAWRQAGLILLVWGHATIGIYMWLRFKPWFARMKGILFSIAVLLPALAFAGFSVAGRQFKDQNSFESPLLPDQYETLIYLMDIALYTSLALIGSLLLFKAGQYIVSLRHPKVRVTYNSATVKTAPKGLTLLEISKLSKVPHAAICGGRARCSTCRVRVLSGGEHLLPADELELKALQRAGITDEQIRLACQVRPLKDVSILQLVPAEGKFDKNTRTSKMDQGVEKIVTIMFIDIRGFTRFAEGRLPYDVVFLLNQYLGRMSDAITSHGGYVDKFMGDGIMAIFGIDTTSPEGAKDALRAAAAISLVIDDLNQSHSGDLPEGLQIGIGIHTGEAILGKIGASSGHNAGDRLTALGDTVNTASRLESLTKEMATQCLVSVTCLKAARVDKTNYDIELVAIRGRDGKLGCVRFDNAAQLQTMMTIDDSSVA